MKTLSLHQAAAYNWLKDRLQNSCNNQMVCVCVLFVYIIYVSFFDRKVFLNPLPIFLVGLSTNLVMVFEESHEISDYFFAFFYFI